MMGQQQGQERRAKTSVFCIDMLVSAVSKGQGKEGGFGLRQCIAMANCHLIFQ
jgi:hypothetical protein